MKIVHIITDLDTGGAEIMLYKLLSLFPFGMNGHYNEKGYQLVAKTIFKTISELEK